MDLTESEGRLGGGMALECGEVICIRKQNTSQKGTGN